MGRGKHQASLDLIAVAREILEEVQPATVRACCYRLFVGGVIPDMSKASTQRVSMQLTWAREHDRIPWDWIVDETREAERVSSWNDPRSFIDTVRRSYRKDLWNTQSEFIEVWSEKGTVRGTLWPVLHEYGVAFRVLHGWASATSVHEAAEESRYRGFTVLYVGDFDPSGMYMSEVDRLGWAVTTLTSRSNALRCGRKNVGDLKHFDLASKRRDPRHSWYPRRFGHRCWELDAMNPVHLRDRVETAIRSYIDPTAWELAQKTEAAEVATIDNVLNRWQQAISGPDAK